MEAAGVLSVWWYSLLLTASAEARASSEFLFNKHTGVKVHFLFLQLRHQQFHNTLRWTNDWFLMALYNNPFTHQKLDTPTMTQIWDSWRIFYRQLASSLTQLITITLPHVVFKIDVVIIYRSAWCWETPIMSWSAIVVDVVPAGDVMFVWHSHCDWLMRLVTVWRLNECMTNVSLFHRLIFMFCWTSSGPKQSCEPLVLALQSPYTTFPIKPSDIIKHIFSFLIKCRVSRSFFKSNQLYLYNIIW